jgi:excisionase family DNA binding protein
MDDKEKMTVNQAADHLGVKPITIYKHLERGNIKGDKGVGGMWLILITELDKIKGVKPGPKPKTRVAN